MADFDTTETAEIEATDVTKAEIDACDKFDVGTDEGV